MWTFCLIQQEWHNLWLVLYGNRRMKPSLLYKESQGEKRFPQNIALLWYTLWKHITPLSEKIKWLLENIFYCTIFKALPTSGSSSLLAAVHSWSWAVAGGLSHTSSPSPFTSSLSQTDLYTEIDPYLLSSSLRKYPNKIPPLRFSTNKLFPTTATNTKKVSRIKSYTTIQEFK